MQRSCIFLAAILLATIFMAFATGAQTPNSENDEIRAILDWASGVVER